jgi:hypothetical protein
MKGKEGAGGAVKAAKEAASTTSTTSSRRSERRPRFRAGTLAGRNLRRHPRRVLKGEGVVPALASGKEAVAGFHAADVTDRGSRQVRLRSTLKDLYEIRSSKRRGKAFVRANSHWRRKPGSRETRVDVLLHRAGLANSIQQARQRVTHGHVKAWRPEGERVYERPTQRVKPGQLVAIQPAFWWGGHQEALKKQWSKWPVDAQGGEGRCIPEYLEVDYTTGARVLVSRPTLETVLRPVGLGKAAEQLRW